MSKPRIRIYGCMSGDLRKHFRKAIEYYANQLMNPQLARNLKINLYYQKVLNDKTSLGECEVVGNEKKPRKFNIFIKPMKNSLKNRVDMLSTLAHEMIHVKQYAYSQLRFMDNCSQKTKWNGRNINERLYEYENLPWEKEAFLGEDRLFVQYVDETRSYDYFFGKP